MATREDSVTFADNLGLWGSVLGAFAWIPAMVVCSQAGVSLYWGLAPSVLGILMIFLAIKLSEE